MFEKLHVTQSHIRSTEWFLRFSRHYQGDAIEICDVFEL